MRKVLILMLLILTLSSPVFCETTWFSPYSASFAVDLKNGTSNGNPVRGTDSGIYLDPKPSADNDPNADYNELTNMVGTIGITNGGSSLTQGTYSVAFNFDNTDWTYISQSDRSLQIPFGIDIVIRYRVKHDQTDGYFRPYIHEIADYTYKVGGKNFLEFGYGKDGKLVGETGGAEYYINTSEIDLDPENRFETQRGPLGNVQREFTNTLVGIWVDIILILQDDPAKRYEGMFQIGAADDYMTSFDVEVNGTNYPVVMTGVYGSDHYSGSGSVLFTVSSQESTYTILSSGYFNSQPIDDTLIFTVIPDAAAKSISIENLLGGVSIPVASYEFTTITLYRADAQSPYFIFASSSESFDDPDGQLFTMTNTENPDSSFNYIVEIASSSCQRTPFSGIFILGNSEMSPTQTTTDRLPNGTTAVTYSDSGTIEINIGDNKIPGSLAAGYYSSDIYLHVVSKK